MEEQRTGAETERVEKEKVIEKISENVTVITNFLRI